MLKIYDNAPVFVANVTEAHEPLNVDGHSGIVQLVVVRQIALMIVEHGYKVEDYGHWDDLMRRCSTMLHDAYKSQPRKGVKYESYIIALHEFLTRSANDSSIWATLPSDIGVLAEHVYAISGDRVKNVVLFRPKYLPKKANVLVVGTGPLHKESLSWYLKKLDIRVSFDTLDTTLFNVVVLGSKVNPDDVVGVKAAAILEDRVLFMTQEAFLDAIYSGMTLQIEYGLCHSSLEHKGISMAARALQFMWPNKHFDTRWSYKGDGHDFTLASESFLHKLGYNVQSGSTVNARRRILDNVMRTRSCNVLRTVAYLLDWCIVMNHKKPAMKAAVAKWTEDLEYMYKTYYVGSPCEKDAGKASYMAWLRKRF